MAQYYQVTSLEELHRLYPNLQLDNLEGISCMIQDDQVAHYTDGQGQQVIATVEQSGMQLTQNPPVSRCSPQQSQFVVHQPTQYVIQQMDATESQTPPVQYIQQRPIDQNKKESSETQVKDQNMGCVATDVGNEDQILHQRVVKQEGSQQFLPQVQPILPSPIQISQQIQAVDMGPNILVLQNQEQELFINSNKSPELLVSQEKQHQPPHQIIIQSHQDQTAQQIVVQRDQIIEKNENSQEFTQHQILQNQRPSQSGGQQQVIHHQQQPVIQQLQYYNQVTVLDSFSQPNVTIEHHTSANESLPQQHQVRPQVQQFRPKKTVQTSGLPTTIQDSQVLMSQRFEMASSRVPLIRKKVPQDVQGSQPVFVVQKVDSPYLIRPPQAKIKCQSPSMSSDEVNDNSYQTMSLQTEQNLEVVKQENQQGTQSPLRSKQQVEGQQKNMVPVGQSTATQVNKFPVDRNSTCGHVKIGIVEQPFGSRVGDQASKTKVASSVSAKIPRLDLSRIKSTEQQTDPINEGKEIDAQQFQRWVGNVHPQSQLSTVLPSQQQSQNQIQVFGRGRGIRGPVSPRGGHQYVPRAHGVQVQTSPPRLPNVKGGGIGRRLKSPQGGGKGGRGGSVPCGLDQRATTPIRVATPQVIHNPGTKVESSETSNENMEDARMVVVFLNGEKKVLKIPCSQPNILLGQILQQAGVVTTPTSIAIEQIADPNSEHFVVKSSPGNNRQSSTFAPNQTVNVSTPIGMPKGIVAAIQHRPRGHSPVLPQATNVGIIRQRLHFAHSRVTSPNVSLPATVTSNLVAEGVTSQAQNSQSSTPTSQPSKELPRFVSGFMAICPFCGISSLDFNKCIRCRRKLPENVKSQSIFSVKKKKADKAVGNTEKSSDDGKFELEDKQLSDAKEKNLLQGCDRKKPKPCLKKKKISDEPAEILILSSDEEEETKTKKSNLTSLVSTVLRKEPVYTSVLSEADMANILKESNLNEDLMKNIQPGSFTTLQCRTIRVGSYKVQPKERVLISTKGLKLVVNSLKNENATIIIPITDILKTLIHFGKQIPVIFIYPVPKVGFQIRNILGMENKMGPYYDPTSTQEETHKRITLLLEKITEDNKMALFKIFGQSKIEELSEKEANEILIRASPVDIQNPSLNKLTDGVRKIMVYPPPPEKGGITLNNQDYACLGEDQFLNDVIIDFYLKYLMLQVLSPTDRNRTHVFSTFFYKRLTTKPKTLRKNDPENDPKLSPAEKRHMRVKGWTKQVNLFEKDFIIVPINEHSHWFLAIICFPGLTGPVKFSDNTPVDPEEVIPKKSSHSVQIGSTTITHIIKTDGNKIEMDSVSDRDEAEGDQDDLHPSSEDEESEQAEEESNAASQSVQIPLLTNVPSTPSGVKDAKAKVIKKKPLKEPIKQPCILIFDSLAGASRVRVVATLRDYLKIEYKMKMGQDRTFSKDTIKGAVPKVPQQNNFTDCGLYVLQYVESFFQDPLHDFKLPLKYLQEWFSEEVVSYKRQKLAYLIRSLMQEQGINVEEMGLPVLTFSNGSVPPGDPGRMEDEEMDEEEINEDEELNEEDEEMLRNRIQISAFVNEDDEDLNLEDEDDDLEDDELDEDLDEEEEDELEVGEMRWLGKGNHSCIESESSVRHGGKRIIKTSPLVDYEPSDSDDDGQILCHNSEIIGEDPTTVHPDLAEDREYSETEPSLVSESIKSVPLTEFQDFESQITCTTIERNVEGKNTESDTINEEEEEEGGEEGQSSKATDEGETLFKTPNFGNRHAGTDNLNQSLGRNLFRSTELVTDGGSMEVTNIIKKLVNDKNITISRKEDDLNLNLNKKQLDLKRFKVKDCDKSEEAKKATSSYSSQKNNVGSCKRSFQALKNVRIQKKTERKLDVCGKRQKVDER